jgi:hypothetical protein
MGRSLVFLRNVRLCRSVPLFLAQIATANYIAYQMWFFGLSGETTAGTVLFVLCSQLGIWDKSLSCYNSRTGLNNKC